MLERREIAERAKRQKILDTALTFTAMMRLFSAGSKERIARKLEEITSSLDEITSAQDYDGLQKRFCEWFRQEIRTAEKQKRETGEVIKSTQPASFGQAAKLLDIALKVYVFYCGQPLPVVAARIHPFLHGAVDVPIMGYLKRKFPEVPIQATTIEQVDERVYQLLQHLGARDIGECFHSDVLLVQCDDIMWQRLNRSAGVPE